MEGRVYDWQEHVCGLYELRVWQEPNRVTGGSLTVYGRSMCVGPNLTLISEFDPAPLGYRLPEVRV